MRLLAIGLATWAVLRIFSVPVAPVVTNDSLGYLTHALDLSGEGLVRQGYRLFGYPAFVRSAYILSQYLPLDPLSTLAWAQHLLFAASVLYLLKVMGLWAAPIVLLLTSQKWVALQNFILTEGLALSLCCLFCALVFEVVLRPRTRLVNLLIYLGASCCLFWALTAVRIQYAAAGAIIAATALRLIVGRLRTGAAVLAAGWFGLSAVGAALMLYAMAAENFVEAGVFSPSTGGARAGYWGAYDLVFASHREQSIENPALQQFFDNSGPVPFIHSVDRMDLTTAGKAQVLKDRRRQLLEAAGLDERLEGYRSAWYFLARPRYNDIGGLINAQIEGRSKILYIGKSPFYPDFRDDDAFYGQFNEGRRPAKSEPPQLLRKAARLVNLEVSEKLLRYASIILVLIGLLLPGCRLMSLGVLITAGAIALAHGMLFADIWRYTTASAAMVGVTAAFVLKCQLGSDPNLRASIDRAAARRQCAHFGRHER